MARATSGATLDQKETIVRDNVVEALKLVRDALDSIPVIQSWPFAVAAIPELQRARDHLRHVDEFLS